MAKVLFLSESCSHLFEPLVIHRIVLMAIESLLTHHLILLSVKFLQILNPFVACKTLRDEVRLVALESSFIPFLLRPLVTSAHKSLSC